MTAKNSDEVMKRKGFKFLPERTVKLESGWIAHTFKGSFANIPSEVQLSSSRDGLTLIEIKADLFELSPTTSDRQIAVCRKWFNELVKFYGRGPDRSVDTSFFWEGDSSFNNIHLACQGEFSVILEIDL